MIGTWEEERTLDRISVNIGDMDEGGTRGGMMLVIVFSGFASTDDACDCKADNEGSKRAANDWDEGENESSVA